MRHVVFRVERERCAIPLSAVKELLEVPSLLTPVPRTGVLVKGVMNLRGRVIPIVELAVLMSIKTTKPAKKIVLLDRGRRDLGLLITEVEGIESLDKITSAGSAALPFVRGLSRLGALALTVLDVDALDTAVAQKVASR